MLLRYALCASTNRASLKSKTATIERHTDETAKRATDSKPLHALILWPAHCGMCCRPQEQPEKFQG